MTISYKEIYSFFLGSIKEYEWIKLNTDVVYELMVEYLHKVAVLPYVRSKFSSLSFDDISMQLSFELKCPMDEESDKLFVSEIIFAKGMTIFWLEKEKNNKILIDYAVYGKEERVFSPSGQLTTISNIYKEAVMEHKDLICDYGYYNNSYIRS